MPPQRVFCSIALKTGAQNVELLSTRLVGCDDPDGQLNREIAINNFRGSKNPGIVLEFHQFEAQAQNFSTKCTLRLQTKRGDKVIQQTEDEFVNITVPFFVTQFDDALSTIEDKIDDAKDEAKNDLWKTIGVLNDIFETVRAICQVSPFIILIIEVIDAWQSNSGEVLKEFIVTAPIAAAQCGESAEQQAQLNSISKFLQVLCTIASCNTEGVQISSYISGLQWYTELQKNVLDFYNYYSGRYLVGRPATSLYDNAFLSVAGICLPGIIYNMDKYRQIQCRYIYCLENEVKGGVATLESCRELKDYQECKYVWGEVFQIIPFVGGIDQLLSSIKASLSDPSGLLGFANTVAARICAAIYCEASPAGKQACDIIAFVMFLVDTVNSFIVAFTQVEAVSHDYCQQVL